MQVLPSFDPSAALSGNIDVSASDSGCKVLLYNLSIIAVKLNFGDGSTAILHAGEANWFDLDGNTPTIEWSQYSVLNAQVGPLSQVTVTLYRPDEKIEGNYPFSLIYLLAIGNSIPLSTTAVAVVNSGNVAGTNILTGQVSGDGSNAVNITNDAQVTFGDASHNANVSITGTETVTNLNVNTLNASGNIIEANSESLQWKDSGGTARTVMQVDGGNNTQIFGVAGTDKIQLLSSGGSLAALFDLVNKSFNLNTGSTVINGGANGSATHWMPLQGSALKMVIIEESNFQTGVGNQDYSLPTAFTNGAYFWTGSCVTWSFLNNGSVQNCNVVTAIGTSNFQSTVTGYTFGNLAPTVPFNGIRHNGGAGSAHTGWIIIVGN